MLPLRIMARQLRLGGAPAGIMHHYAARDEQLRRAVAAAGRNEPCPRGSGRKTKHCHASAVTEPAR
jgi:uncharacterized protein